MKLLFIYGPPAAGKLTIAQSIAEQTDFRLFHNHLTIDLAKDIFEDRKVRSEVVAKLRLDIIEVATKANINIIFTMVYAKQEDDEYVRKIVSTVENNGGQVCFVQLIPDASELEKRVTLSSRRSFSKIKDVINLRKIIDSADLYSVVPYKNNLSINNTRQNPSDVANQIISHFDLA